jgi:hypothetical protein
MDECETIATPSFIRQILNDESLYERYENLTLERGLDLMQDVCRCVRAYNLFHFANT